MVAGTPGSKGSIKRKNNFQTPAAKSSKPYLMSSPGESKTQMPETNITSFADRANAGQIIESLNGHITIPDSSSTRPTETRVKLKANTEIAKFNYKSMAMKLSEASEILDDRIDEFTLLIQQEHGFEDSAFGNPAAQSTSEIITVGRIASDVEGKLNAASLVLETSRRMGAGLRVPLRMENQSFDFFPGKIVALRGNNPSGEFFAVTEVITMPLLHLPASTPSEIEAHAAKVEGDQAGDSRPLNFIVSSGPYTPDTDLEYSALRALLEKATESAADVVLLNGPFLDIEHPLIASGDFDLPSDYPVSADRVTLQDAFRAFISKPLARFAEQNPTTIIILVPSIREAVSRHVSWPQDRFPKKELGLPKQVTCVTNPITISINELVVGISSQDVLFEMQRQTVAQNTNKISDDLLARLSANLIQQRHFFPVFPPLAPENLPRPTATGAIGIHNEPEERTASGANIDISYLKLGEWLQVRPDLLITPSVLTPFAKVVESVVVVNPGTLSKRRGPGTYAQMTIQPRKLKENEQNADVVGHELFNRARVDVVRV